LDQLSATTIEKLSPSFFGRKSYTHRLHSVVLVCSHSRFDYF